MSSGSSLPSFSLRRPVTVTMTMVAFTLIGVIAYFQIPLQLFPSGYSAPFLFVRIIYPSSTPKEIEDQIVRPAEELFATIEGLKRMRAWANDSDGSFWLRFEDNLPMSTIYNQVRDRLERLMPTLPDGVERYFIWKWDPDAEPIYYFGISSPRPFSRESYRTLDQQLFMKIQRMSGVSRLDVTGIEQPEIRIEVDQKRARAHRISLYQIINALRNDNFTLPSGRFEEGGRMYYLRSDNRLQSLADLRRYPILPGVQLGEIAKVIYGLDPHPQLYRIDKNHGIFLQVFKESEANTVQLSRRLEKLIREAFEKTPELAGFQLHTFTNQGASIEDALWQLQTSAMWGAFFALLILGLFLRHFRMTLLVLIAIPLSLLLTLAVLYFMKESLNILSLMGLMLSAGMVVDNAIVVVENIVRMRQLGLEPKDASREGASEVALAILLATSTTIVVFLPLMLMSGSKMFRFYMSKLGYPVSIALLASLLVALMVVPLGASKLLKGDVKESPWPFFDRVTDKYHALLAWTIRHRFDAAVITTLAMLTILYPMDKIQRTFESRPGSSEFSMRFTFPQSYNFDQKLAYLQKVEEITQKYKEEWGVKHVLTDLKRYSNNARVSVILAPGKRKVSTSRRELGVQIGPLLPEAPGVTRRVGWRAVGGGGASMTMHLYGADSQTLEKLAYDLERHLQQYPAFKNTEADLDRDQLPELQLQLLREWSFRYQFPAQMIGSNIYYSLSGRKLRNFQIDGRDIPARIQVQQENVDSLQKLQQLSLYRRETNQGVPLNQLVKTRYSVGPRSIQRVERKTFLRMKISTESEDLARLYTQIDAVMASFPMPEGYTWDKGYEFRDLAEADASRLFALLLSGIFVFLLMGILFESFLLPFSVLLSIPMAFLGVYWILYLTGTTLDMMAGIGLVMLIGIVVNNAIVMVDRINQLRLEGVPREKAILDACTQRLRPILMTALTTIFGLVPMVAGDGAMIGISYGPLGWTVIGGLTASTFLSLLVVPLFYTFFDDLRGYVFSLLAAVSQRRIF